MDGSSVLINLFYLNFRVYNYTTVFRRVPTRAIYEEGLQQLPFKSHWPVALPLPCDLFSKRPWNPPQSSKYRNSVLRKNDFFFLNEKQKRIIDRRRPSHQNEKNRRRYTKDNDPVKLTNNAVLYSFSAGKTPPHRSSFVLLIWKKNSKFHRNRTFILAGKLLNFNQ